MVSPNLMMLVFIRRKSGHRDGCSGKKAHDDEAETGSDTATCQATLRIVSNRQEARKGTGGSFPDALEEVWWCLHFDFRDPVFITTRGYIFVV